MGSDPQRKIGGRFRDRRVDILAERQNVRFGVEGAPETRSDSASSPVSIVPAG